jgi:hypothetical protein
VHFAHGSGITIGRDSSSAAQIGIDVGGDRSTAGQIGIVTGFKLSVRPTQPFTLPYLYVAAHYAKDVEDRISKILVCPSNTEASLANTTTNCEPSESLGKL